MQGPIQPRQGRRAGDPSGSPDGRDGNLKDWQKNTWFGPAPTNNNGNPFDEPEDLLDAAKEGGCDVAFLDIHMSGMTGVELAKALKGVNPKMNIIFVTGFSEYTGDAMALRASGYIMKPVTKEAVEEELSELRFPIVPKSNALLKVQCFGDFCLFGAPSRKLLHHKGNRGGIV